MHDVSTQNLTNQFWFIKARESALTEIELGKIKRRMVETGTTEQKDVMKKRQLIVKPETVKTLMC